MKAGNKVYSSGKRLGGNYATTAPHLRRPIFGSSRKSVVNRLRVGIEIRDEGGDSRVEAVRSSPVISATYSKTISARVLASIEQSSATAHFNLGIPWVGRERLDA